MQDPKDSEASSLAEDDLETFVADYLARAEEGGAPELEEYLERLPSAHRDICRERIATASRVRRTLAELRTAAATEQAAGALPGLPAIKGFRIERELGRGGLGTVYLAWDEALQRRVALKVLRSGTAAGVRARVLAEARRAAAFQDPAIVTIYSVVDDAEHPGIVMEYVEGYPLDKAAAGLDFRQKARLLQALARALALAHARGVIHRDLKPENVLVTPELHLKVLDFGLAISLGAETGPRGLFEGTPLYASPEQAAGRALSPASDIFSFGSVMFTVLAGRPPFEGETLNEVLERIATHDPPFPRTLAAAVPEDLQAICLACLAKEPAERPSAGDCATDLGRFIAGEAVRLRPSLYRDILRRRIAEHTGDLREWEHQGMISREEHDRLDIVYRRILADEDHWIVDVRRLTLTQTVLYTASWVVVVALVLLVWMARDDVPPAARWLAPAAATVTLLGVGLFAHRRAEFMASASFLAAAVLSAVPTSLSLLGELGLLAERPEGVGQLLAPPFSNAQVLAASVAGLVLSAAAFWRLRMAGFAWTTAVLGSASYLAALLLLGWLDWDPEVQALWCLPLVLLEGCALLSEKRGRVRWAHPFHLVALVALVASLDVIAAEGTTVSMLGLAESRPTGNAEPFLNPARQEAYSFTLNGVVFLALMLLTERARSLDLRRASHLLGTLASIHILGSLYRNALEQRGEEGVWIDATIYLTAASAVILLGPWRGRRQFLMAGLAGVALGSHLVLELDLVRKAPFVLVLGAAALAAALGTYAYLHVRPRSGVAQ